MDTNKPVVRFLQDYSQLSSVVDKTSLYFVREAGDGPHSDPTVHKGWAVYCWDTELGNWHKIIEQESLDTGGGGGGGSIDPSILEQYVKKTEIAEFIAKCNTAIEKATNAETAAAQAHEDALQAASDAQEASLKAEAAQDTVDTLMNGIASITKQPRETVTVFQIYDMLMAVLDAARKE